MDAWVVTEGDYCERWPTHVFLDHAQAQSYAANWKKGPQGISCDHVSIHVVELVLPVCSRCGRKHLPDEAAKELERTGGKT